MTQLPITTVTGFPEIAGEQPFAPTARAIQTALLAPCLDLLEKALALSNVPGDAWAKKHLDAYNEIRAFLKAHGREIK